MTVFRITGYSVALFLAVLYGMAAQRFHFPPYHTVQAAAVRVRYSLHDEYVETPVEYFGTNVSDLISIRERADVDRLRLDLRQFLWGMPGPPTTSPQLIQASIQDDRYDDLDSVARIEKFTVVMDYGLESQIYHFSPQTPNRRVVFFHEGHDGDFFSSKAHIQSLLREGYSVFAFAMPLLGMNNQPTVNLPRLGKLKLTSHDHLKFLKPPQGHPVKYFLEPVICVLNYVKTNSPAAPVYMIGVSGGGWTTTLAAAVDPRIELSFPVAGTYPIFLRSNSSRDWGDYEQTVPELYATVTYLEMYILGAVGPHRAQIQILGQYDPECFAGTKWETYRDVVRDQVKSLNEGEYDLFVDTTPFIHGISPSSMARILEAMQRHREPFPGNR